MIDQGNNDMTGKILINELPCSNGGKIGHIRLNKPNAMNALDLDMVEESIGILKLWRCDDNIQAVFIDSEGDRAFCAGGDIVSLYKAMKTHHSNRHLKREENSCEPADFIAQFFEHEYKLDYFIHAYSKPIIAWGNGVIMGGGMGVFMGASHKIVTENARIAMPEMSIGLFPDVGASYFLNQLPKGLGEFLALTSSQINARDCLEIGLVDHCIAHAEKDKFLENLRSLTTYTDSHVSSICEDLQADTILSELPSNLLPITKSVSDFDFYQNLGNFADFLNDLAQKQANYRFFEKAIESFAYGSPLSARVLTEQLHRGRDLTVADCFRMELSIAYKCGASGEFLEGIRALLIDKDKTPNWRYLNIESVENHEIDAHFTQFDEFKINPLANLERDFGEPRYEN